MAVQAPPKNLVEKISQELGGVEGGGEVKVSAQDIKEYLLSKPLPAGASFRNLDIESSGGRATIRGEIQTPAGGIKLRIDLENSPRGDRIQVSKKPELKTNFIVRRMLGDVEEKLKDINEFIFKEVNEQLESLGGAQVTGVSITDSGEFALKVTTSSQVFQTTTPTELPKEKVSSPSTTATPVPPPETLPLPHPSPPSGSPSSPHPAPTSPAERLEQDPRYKAIKDELIAKWEDIHGPRWQGNILRPEFQDYLFGTKPGGRKQTSLEERARKVFKEQYPDDFVAYEEKEKKIKETAADQPTKSETTQKPSTQTPSSTSPSQPPPKPPAPPPPSPPPPSPPQGPPSPPPGPPPGSPPGPPPSPTPPIPEAEGGVPYGTTRWPYYVAPPFWGAWAITDPAGAFAALPYGAVGIPAYIGYKKLRRKIQDLKENLEPLRWITAPGQQLKDKLTSASGRLLRRGVSTAAETLGGGWLFKVQKVMGPDGRLYKSFEFMPAAWTREKVGKFFEKLGGGRDKSRFTKTAKNLRDYKIGYDSHRRPKARRKMRGIGILFGLFGALIVGAIIDEIWDRFKRKFLKGARATRTLAVLRERGVGLSRSWRVAKGGASWNTAAGAALGYAIGGPVGAVIGGSGGAFYSMVKNAAEEPHWKYRYRLSELEKTGELKKITLPPQMKPFGKWQARLYRPSALLARRELLRYAPLQGVALGFIVGGPQGAAVGGGAQFLWMSRGFAKRQLANAADALTVRLSPKETTPGGFSVAKYPRFDTFLRKGPAWARGGGWGLEQFRYPRRYAAGAGIGGLLGFSLSGGSPWGAAAGAAVGGGTQIAASGATRFTTRQIRAFYRKYPYSKGATLGIIGAGIAMGLGVPAYVAVPAGIGGGIAAQWIARKATSIFGKRAGTVAGEAAETALSTRGLKLLGKGLVGRGLTAIAAFDLGRSLFKEAISQLEYELKTGKMKYRFPWQSDKARPKWQIKAELYFAKGMVAVLDVVLIPWDWFWSKGIGYLYDAGAKIGGFLGDTIGKFLTKLPGPIGDAFGWVGDRLGDVGDLLKGIFGGTKDIVNAVAGFAQGVASAVLAFFSAVGTLVFGGDVVEAAIAIAIALVFTGALFNTGIAGAFPDELVSLIGNLTGLVKNVPGPGESQYVTINKTVLELEGQILVPPGEAEILIVCPNNDCSQALPKKATFQLSIQPTGYNLQNLVCGDRTALLKTDGTIEDITSLIIANQSDLGCPDKLGATDTWTKTIDFEIPNEPRFYNAQITNTFALAGEASVGSVPPNNDNCGGRYTLNNPLGNFGDPNCDFSLERLSQFILNKDPTHLNKWLCIQSYESPGQGPNAVNLSPDVPDPGGAWGLFQMASQNFGSPNTPRDVGDVEWHLQTANAIDYNNIDIGGSFGYWQPVLQGSC